MISTMRTVTTTKELGKACRDKVSTIIVSPDLSVVVNSIRQPIWAMLFMAMLSPAGACLSVIVYVIAMVGAYGLMLLGLFALNGDSFDVWSMVVSFSKAGAILLPAGMFSYLVFMALKICVHGGGCSALMRIREMWVEELSDGNFRLNDHTVPHKGWNAKSQLFLSEIELFEDFRPYNEDDCYLPYQQEIQFGFCSDQQKRKFTIRVLRSDCDNYESMKKGKVLGEVMMGAYAYVIEGDPAYYSAIFGRQVKVPAETRLAIVNGPTHIESGNYAFDHGAGSHDAVVRVIRTAKESESGFAEVMIDGIDAVILLSDTEKLPHCEKGMYIRVPFAYIELDFPVS